jgi:peptide/nickel transport system substrate-binding protein
VAEKFLKEGSLMYLYHRRLLVAHTAKLQDFKLLPDGLVRVVGLKLAP